VKKHFIPVPECIICGNPTAVNLFQKKGTGGLHFNLAACENCGLEFLHPRPTEEEIIRCYDSDYFTRRTDRGYDDYFSEPIRSEIERVIALNLKALSFDRYENDLVAPRRSLDIGCAAGYFVNHLRGRGWESQGIDVSKPCTDFALKKLSLSVLNGNYLETVYLERFDLITLWATIEHLHHPELVLAKAFKDLRTGGMIYLSTCRTGFGFMKLFGSSWRYYNFPEHLFFFSLSNLKKLLRKNGFKITCTFTYGSGFGKPKTILRRIADFAARRLRLGDMMVIAAQKPVRK
jgi:2-polyprenyl-3-methyl-5-hydroxy-6-metoxy-1,4-benzoquinol methylase